MTPSQLAASSPNISAWVSASAGTGKTKVLTDRVLRLLLAGNHPAKILCLTFTKAAAAEMSNRINNELARWVVMDEKSLINRLCELTGEDPTAKVISTARNLFIQVLDAADSLKIQTIHSFCQSLLQRFPIEAGIATNCQTIDEASSGLVLQEAKMNLLGSLVTEEESDLKQAVNFISWHIYESNLQDLIENIIDNQAKLANIFAKFNYDIESLIKRGFAIFGLGAEDNEENILNKFVQCLDDNILKSIAAMIDSSTKGELSRAHNLLNWLSLNSEDRIKKFILYQEFFLTKTNSPRKIISKDLGKNFPQLEGLVAYQQQQLLILREKINSVKIATRTKNFLYLALGFLRQYNILKNKKSVVDYDDLINIAEELLSNSASSAWVLYKLDGGIDHILVDEAQDTSRQQWRIIENLTAEFYAGSSANDTIRTLFVVGDEKQSIFSFQGADPLTFSYMHKYFTSKAAQLEQRFLTVNLDISFRSSSAVLSLVDNIFKDEKLKKSVSNNNSKITHKAFRSLDAGNVELWPLITASYERDNEKWQLPIKRQTKHNPSSKLAELIAVTIEQWLLEKRVLKSKNRYITEGDIMILVRRRNEFTETLVKELKKRSIKVAGIDRMQVKENIAIMDLMALGNFLLLPQDDLNLACLLKSPLIGLSEEELLQLSCQRTSSIWNSLKDQARNNLIFSIAHNKLSDLLKITDYTTPFKLFSYALEVKGGRKNLCSRLGMEANDPIDEFLNLALIYEKNNIPSLQGFLKWLESSSIEIKRDLEHSRNQIRIMTVHSSKGLQAPIVIMPDTTSIPLARELLLFDEKENLVYWPGATANYNNHCDNLRKQQAELDLKEYYRLLYVALTRAEDELIICGYKGKNNPAEDCWYKIIEKVMREEATEKDFVVPKGLQDYLSNNKYLKLEFAQQRELPDFEDKGAILKEPIKIPEFAIRNAPSEPSPPMPLVASSRLVDRTSFKSPILLEKSLIKGNLIHKLLEFLPSSSSIDRTESMEKFLHKYAPDFSNIERQQIISSCLTILQDPNFSYIFSDGSRAEVPITGIIENKFIISGQIDRLIITDDKVIIIDYKTNLDPPSSEIEVPSSYLRQMAAYRLLLKQIYPSKVITCALIWTQGPLLMEISSNLLESQQLSDVII